MTQEFTTKDSGARVEFDSGMVRDTDAGKPRYDLVPIEPFRRLAKLYARGSVKYGDRNWELADSPAELARFKASAFRHFMDWLDGKTDEDHGVATVFNIFAVLHLEARITEPRQLTLDVSTFTESLTVTVPESIDDMIPAGPNDEYCGMEFDVVGDFWYCGLIKGHKGKHAWPTGNMVEIDKAA